MSTSEIHGFFFFFDMEASNKGCRLFHLIPAFYPYRRMLMKFYEQPSKIKF